jgi:hypothetical protein
MCVLILLALLLKASFIHYSAQLPPVSTLTVLAQAMSHGVSMLLPTQLGAAGMLMLLCVRPSVSTLVRLGYDWMIIIGHVARAAKVVTTLVGAAWSETQCSEVWQSLHVLSGRCPDALVWSHYMFLAIGCIGGLGPGLNTRNLHWGNTLSCPQRGFVAFGCILAATTWGELPTPG